MKKINTKNGMRRTTQVLDKKKQNWSGIVKK